jgi:hypothetical protein
MDYMEFEGIRDSDRSEVYDPAGGGMIHLWLMAEQLRISRKGNAVKTILV